MSNRIFIFAGIIVITGTIIGGIMTVKKHNDPSPDTRKSTNTSVINISGGVFDTEKNINTTDQRPRVLAIRPTGRRVNLEEKITQAGSQDFYEKCIEGGLCFNYLPLFLPCSSSFNGVTHWYLLVEADRCEGQQDAPTVVIEKINTNTNSGSLSVYERLFTAKDYFIEDQVEVDEMVSKKNGKTVSCYDTKWDRVCKITLVTGQEYSIYSSWYNSMEITDSQRQLFRENFDVIILSILDY